MAQIIAVVGPTAAGKTAYAHELALARNGEIVNMDARQVYRHMRIGVAQPDFVGDLHEIDGIAYHLFEIIDPSERIDVAQYALKAHAVIQDILSRGKTPILVGGTGFYVDSVCRGAVFGEKVLNIDLRETLEIQPLHTLVAQLQRIAPDIALRTDCQNKRRVVRALERILGGEVDVTYTDPYDVSYIGVLPDREVLKERIATRVISMIEHGLENEVRAVIDRYGTDAPGMSAIGYKEWIPYFSGFIAQDEVIRAITASTWQYARRQITWFKKNTLIYWI